MVTATVLSSGAVSAVDYRCSSGPAEAPYTECHEVLSVSYVRKGNFGYHTRGRFREMVAGSVLVGHAGDEYVCTHDHHVCGDECLSFRHSPELAPELAEAISGKLELRQISSLPPLPEMMVLGELAQGAAEGANDIGLDEAGLMFAARFAEIASGRPQTTVAATGRAPSAPRCGWTNIRTAPSTSKARPARRISASFISSGSSRKYSA